MKIGILGAGVMGQLFGAHLISAGYDVTLIDTSEAICEGINQDGIRINMSGEAFHVEAVATPAERISSPLDIVFVFTKGFHTESAVQSVQPLLAPEAVGVTLQNGLGNEIALQAVFGKHQTVIGMTDFPADRTADGTIHSESTGYVVVGGNVVEANAHAQLVAEILETSGMNATYDPEVLVPIWEKVIFNTVYNTISGVTGLTVGGVFDEPEAAGIADRVLTEALEVARHVEIPIDEARLRDNIAKAHAHHAEHKTSMLVDIEAGRRTEIDTIGGAVAKIGRSHGLTTPVLSVLVDVLRLRQRAQQH